MIHDSTVTSWLWSWTLLVTNDKTSWSSARPPVAADKPKYPFLGRKMFSARKQSSGVSSAVRPLVIKIWKKSRQNGQNRVTFFCGAGKFYFLNTILSSQTYGENVAIIFHFNFDGERFIPKVTQTATQLLDISVTERLEGKKLFKKSSKI